MTRARQTLAFVHFPFPMHGFALPPARVVEGVGDHGRFEAICHRLYEQQDSFGFKPWSEFAFQAGVSGGGTLETYNTRTEPIPPVVEDEQFGKYLSAQGTPTVTINGWKRATRQRYDS